MTQQQLEQTAHNLLQHFDNDLPMDQPKLVLKALKRFGVVDLIIINKIMSIAINKCLK